jgi:hypothetical protein
METISATSACRPWLAPCPTSSVIVISRWALTGGVMPASMTALKAPRAAATPALSSRWRDLTKPDLVITGLASRATKSPTSMPSARTSSAEDTCSSMRTST